MKLIARICHFLCHDVALRCVKYKGLILDIFVILFILPGTNSGAKIGENRKKSENAIKQHV